MIETAISEEIPKMSEQTPTVEINGRLYDKHTGMPLKSTTQSPAPTHHSGHVAGDVHTHPSRSKTLNRHYVKNPVVPAAKKTIPVQDINHPKITKFASHPTIHAPSQTTSAAHVTPGVHPMVQRVQAARAVSAPAPRTHKPSTVLKKEAIDTALANAKTPTGHHRPKHHEVKRHSRGRILSIASGGLALLLVGAYLTYVSMPSLSVKVAAAQAGVRATYPAYHPSGYGLSGAVAYQPGTVSMKFQQNGGNQGFTLTQANSGWDSGALLNNYVTPKAGADYSTVQDNGLTIYTFGDSAAWVSGGILYTINGDATLSTDQVQHIATSM